MVEVDERVIKPNSILERILDACIKMRFWQNTIGKTRENLVRN